MSALGAWLPSAASPVGPVLCGLGALCVPVAIAIHGFGRARTILHRAPGAAAPSWADRVSVHLIVYAVWALAFGALVWRGPPAGAWDVRLPGEADWPVWAPAEWVYLTGYFGPLALPWLATSRAALRRFALELWVLLGASAAVFTLLPVATPPRAVRDASFIGEVLARELARADFAAASLPSFHVLWTLAGARLLGTLGPRVRRVAWLWPVAMSAACLLNGAHAVADVAASWILYALVAGAAALRRRAIQIPATAPSKAPPPRPSRP